MKGPTIFDRGEVHAFNVAHRALQNALGDLRILSGDEVGPSDASWQDVAGTCAVNLRTLLSYVEGARDRSGGRFVQFPSPDDTDTDTTDKVAAQTQLKAARIARDQ